MQTHPTNDAANPERDDNQFERGPDPDNIRRGTQQPTANGPTGQIAGADAAAPNTASGTPQYGEFGHPDAATAPQQPSRPAGNNPGGVAAPSYAEPEQRGSVPQNLDPNAARGAQEEGYEEQRAAWGQDDPRYHGGTRNWATAEPANASTGPDDDDNAPGGEQSANSNDGSNDNPDEFSSLRPDGGQGVPGK